VQSVDQGLVYEGIDVSFGGLRCWCDLPVWPGNFVDLHLMLPEEPQPIPIRGKVVDLVPHRSRIAMRIQFEELSASWRKRIAIWMAKRANRSA